MTSTFASDDAPQPLHLPLGNRYSEFTLLVLHAGRALHPPGGLQALRGFVRGADGGWLTAAQDAHGHWGLLAVDGAGCHWRVPPQWENAFNPTDGLVRFRQQGLWGCCDPQGCTAIAPRYDGMRPFAQGRAAVREGAGWHWIDPQGRRVDSETFAELFGLDGEGFARARHPGGRAGFVDGEGRWRIAPRWSQVLPFGPGGTAPATEDGALWGLIDRQGAWVLPPRHRRIAAFNASGLAHFCPQGSVWDIRHGYLDARGHVAVAPGPHIAEDMACGIAAAHHDGSRYVRADGSELPAPPLSFGSAFRACDGGGYAIARSATAPAAWGLLHGDGRFTPAPAGLREPLTDWQSLIPAPLPASPCIPFLAEDGGIAWLHPTHGVRWRAHYGAGSATLHDAQGRTLWHGTTAEGYGAPRPFFTAPAEDGLCHLRSLDEAPALADALLAQARERLRDYAAGQVLPPERDPDDDEDSEDDDDEEDDDGEQQSRTHARRRVFRAYLSDELMGLYAFLADEYAAQARHMHGALHAALAAAFGPADAAQTELAQPRRYPPHHPPAWRTPHGWLALYEHHGTGDGDAWWELWLHAAPSAEALRHAADKRAC